MEQTSHYQSGHSWQKNRYLFMSEYNRANEITHFGKAKQHGITTPSLFGSCPRARMKKKISVRDLGQVYFHRYIGSIVTTDTIQTDNFY